MKTIKGYKISELPFDTERVGDLLFCEMPLMTVYKDIASDDPVIYDWVDSGSGIDRMLVYQVSRKNLYDYINKRINHYSLINETINNVIFVIDKTRSEIQNCQVVSILDIPYDYLPGADSNFDDEESRKLEKIIEVFDLYEEIEVLEEHVYDVLAEAKKANSELINLHVSSNTEQVGFGKIYSSLLGKVLVNYQDLRESTASNLYKDKSITGDKKIKIEDARVRHLSETEYYIAKRASFSIFLKPIRARQTEQITQDTENASEKISDFIFKFIEASEDIDALNNFKSHLTKDLISDYNKFLKEIKSSGLSINLQYGNPFNNTKKDKKFTPIYAVRILNNLDVLEVNNVDTKKLKGLFTALDKANHFKFTSDGGEEFKGKFSALLKPGIYRLTLEDRYEIGIEIKTTKKANQLVAIEKNTIISCVKQ